MLNAKDKNLQALKLSHLMQVEEFHKMVLALHRFKEDLAVKAITGMFKLQYTFVLKQFSLRYHIAYTRIIRKMI